LPRPQQRALVVEPRDEDVEVVLERRPDDRLGGSTLAEHSGPHEAAGDRETAVRRRGYPREEVVRGTFVDNSTSKKTTMENTTGGAGADRVVSAVSRAPHCCKKNTLSFPGSGASMWRGRRRSGGAAAMCGAKGVVFTQHCVRNTTPLRGGSEACPDVPVITGSEPDFTGDSPEITSGDSIITGGDPDITGSESDFTSGDAAITGGDPFIIEE
jgi:hypothetical protein